MASLYEIEQAMLACVDMETGEVIDAAQLDALQMERTAKLESVALWIKNLESDVEAYKAEMESFAARRKAAERKIEGLKDYLANALGGEKFSTAKCAVGFRKSQSVDIKDEQFFVTWAMFNDRDDLITKKEPVPNRTAIKQALKEGFTLADVALVEKLNISIK
jgi:hypothetical protein